MRRLWIVAVGAFVLLGGSAQSASAAGLIVGRVDTAGCPAAGVATWRVAQRVRWADDATMQAQLPDLVAQSQRVADSVDLPEDG